MSAICGIVRSDGRPIEDETLREMLAHAPGEAYDRSGTWADGPVGLAQAALDVTPEDLRERQPVRSADGRLVLVADLRLDDREGLVRALGRTPGSEATDAELVLAAYDRWGTECPEHLLGDFAFALWDVARQRLFAARDPLGVRPLYISEERGAVVFGSSVAQLLAVSERSPRLNELAAAAFLAAESPFLDQTFYEGVRQLLPSYALLVQPDGTMRTWRYWDVDFHHRIEYADERQYVEHFRELFGRAVTDRLRSAGPIGIFLSGGLDSGSVASMAGWVRERDGIRASALHAFSFAFDQFPRSDERHVSDRIAERYGFRTHYVHTDEAWPLKDYPAHGPHRDSPLVGAYQVLIEHGLAKARAEGVRLMLSGHRGDLIAGEYILDFPSLLWSGRWTELARELRTHRERDGVTGWHELKRAFALPIRRTLWPLGRAEQVRLRLRRLRRRGRSRYAHLPWVRSEWLDAVGLEEAVAASAVTLPRRGLNHARRERYRAIYMPLHVEVPLWLSRTYAPYGITHADPWSDRRLVEFAMAVPQEVLNKPGEFKRLTRRAMKGIMPEPARQTAGKYVPEALLNHALKKQEQGVVRTMLSDMQAARRGFIDERALQASYEAYLRGETDLPLLWYALSFEMWLRTFWNE
jgi:asparagine synthase (glutamine-hydrolysing)